MTPAGIVEVPQAIAVFIGYLSWDVDLVAVEVVGLLTAFSVFIDAISIDETACVRIAHTLRQDSKFHTGYGLLFTQQCFFK